jgi:hypothetical protein
MNNAISELHTKNGDEVFSYEYIQKLRKQDSDRNIIAQRGGQENSLATDADIVIMGGNRGGSKTYSLLLEGLKDIRNPHFNAVIFRKEKDDLQDIIDKSLNIYDAYGTYNRSSSDMKWYFGDAKGKLWFTFFDDAYNDFVKRFQGKQYCYIGIDEITHIPFEKFKYLMTCNRNAFGIRNRIWGTCNPDPDSWVRRFIDWWIGEDGYAIPERDGIKRYCFMDENSTDTIYWGNSPREVYDQCSDIIDRLWKPEYDALGFDRISMFVKSVVYVRAKLEDNIKLITADPNYVANLAQQDEEARARDLEGNWNFKATGDDILKMDDMERFFNAPHQLGDLHRRASCDIAYDGGDNLVMWLWIGNHLEDVYVIREDSLKTEILVAAKLKEWGVLEKDFTFDLNGIGQNFAGKFKQAVKFNNMAAPIPRDKTEEKSIRYIYSSLKAQCADMLANAIKNGEISINPTLLKRKFSARKYKDMPLYNILMKERKAIRDAKTDKGFALIKKDTMKKYVGWSPDFIEAMMYKMIFDIKSNKPKIKGLGWL